jgi:nucleotide-binding universal stress UspA family protein
MPSVSPLISPVDVAICDPDVMWRVAHMNAVKGVNVREFESVSDALEVVTPEHPMVVVVGPTSPSDEIEAITAAGPRARWLRMIIVERSNSGDSVARAEALNVDRVLSSYTSDADFAHAVLELLDRPDEPVPDSPEAEAGTEAATEGPVRGTKLYEHIIVPFDGTAPAQGATMVGADLARMLGAELVVMTANGMGRAASVGHVKEQAIAISDHSVTVWVEPNANEVEAIATMITFRPKSLICMSTSGRTGVRRAAYGSMPERLVRVVDAPLVLLGPRWTGASIADLRHLVVCVDATPKAEVSVALAAMWAAALPVNATLLHVRTDSSESRVDLDRLAVPLEGRCKIVDKVTVEKADVAQGILDVVKDSGRPLVVMATGARVGLDRMVHGSVMASLISKCDVPVLVQRGPS